jgi:hypothetical protein
MHSLSFFHHARQPKDYPLFQELEEHLIGYERKFQFESTKNWRFDFYIVKLRLLIEIAVVQLPS